MKKLLFAFALCWLMLPTARLDAADCPTFMGGPARTGEVKESGIRPPLKPLWRFRTDGSVRGSVCVVGGIAYACSRDGNVYALDSKTGKLVWQKEIGVLERASASVGRGKVFVALNGGRPRKLFALDAKTGDEIWSRPLPGSHITRNGPLVVNDAVITIEEDAETKKGTLVCFDSGTGEVRWRAVGGNKSLGDPSSDGETVFCCSANGYEDKTSEVFAVEAKTGKAVWRVEGAYVCDAPTLGNGGMSIYDGKLYFCGREAADKPVRIFSLDAKTGAKIWESGALPGGGYTCVPAVTEKTVQVRNVALDRATGKMLWQLPLKMTSCSPAVVAGGYVFFGLSTGVRANNLARGPWTNPKEGLTPLPRAEGASRLLMLDASTGKLVGDFQAMNRVCSAVAVVDDIVYFGSYDGCVYALVHDDKAAPVAFDAPVEVKTELVEEVAPDKTSDKWFAARPNSWPMFRRDASRTGTAPEDLDAKNLALVWSKELGGKVRSSAAIVDGRVYIGSDDGHLYCLDARTGNDVWKLRTGGAVRSSPAVWEGRVYVGSLDHKLYCVDADRGTAVWTFEAGDEIESSPAVVEGTVYFGSLDRKLYVLDARTGRPKWTFTSFGSISASPAVTEDAVCFGAWDSRVYCLSRPDGKVRWARVVEDIKGNPQGGSLLAAPAVAGNRLVMTGDDANVGVGLYDLATGEQLWWHRTGVPVKSSPAVTRDAVFIGTERTFDRVALDTGKEDWHRWPITCFYSSPTLSGQSLFVGCVDGVIYGLSTERDKVLWQFKTKGPVRSSAAIAEGLMVIGSDDGRVYAFGAGGAGAANPGKP